MEFAIFKDFTKGRYVYSLWSGGNSTLSQDAVVREYGAPSEFKNRQNYGDMPKKWRGKPLVEAAVVFGGHHTASGWAQSARVVSSDETR